ncbi:MFS transporter [Phytoactinopolyspora endophytica]|uniref:MFS transporter n=1 Tax=Phytoactinopolyspora endophytica TaxID=1642495 RepID=UPI00197C5C22|nr:MFS transporter [Phytoactinopolyspora endophytica]
MTPTAETTGSILDRRHAPVTIGSVALITLMAYQALAVTTAMPAVAEAIGGVTLYALAFGAPLATALIGMTLSGGWNDARGPSQPLIVGSGLFAAGILIAGLAPSMGVVAIGRGTQGLGTGMMIVALYVLVARVYPRDLRPRVFGAFAAAWVLPALVGPTISGLIAEHIGWRWVFLSVAVLIPPALLAIRPGLRALEDMPDEPPHDDDPAACSVVADGGDATGGGSSPERGLFTRSRAASGPPLHSAVLTQRLGWAVVAGTAASLLHMAGQLSVLTAAALFTAGALGVIAAAPRLLPQGTFRAWAGLPSVVALRGMAAAAFTGAEVFIPLLLVRERGLSPALAGLILTVGAVTWSFGSWLQGRGVLPDRRIRLRLGMALLTAGIAGTTLLVIAVVPVPVGIATWSMAGLGMGLVYPTLSVLVLDLSTSGHQGRNTSSMQVADSLFSALMLALAGTAFAALLSYSGTWPYLSGFTLAGLIAALGIGVAGRAVPRP